MPELPEVETTCRGLARALIGAVVADVTLRRAGLRRPFPMRLKARLRGRKIVAVTRRAKYIVMTFDDASALLLHLGMSGRLLVQTKPAMTKHDHVLIHMTDGRALVFNDPRRFGVLDWGGPGELDAHPLLRHVGVEPLERGLTAAYLMEVLRGKTATIKAALLDQRLIAGLGNIYVCEALFHAGIAPMRRAGRVQAAECARLILAIRRVLRAAIKAGGSSLRDYVHSDGALGFFQNHFAVYDRAGESCPGCTCGEGRIKRIVQSGRASFYCPVKQR